MGTPAAIDYELNRRAGALFHGIERSAAVLRVSRRAAGGGRLFDFGIQAEGGLQAGLLLARVCLADVGEASLVPGEIDGIGWPHVFVRSDAPVAACLLSQYAGWQISLGDYFAMGSGPMRAAYAGEELYEKLGYAENPTECVGVLETAALPDERVFEFLAGKTGVPAERITLATARTASTAGSLQVCARSLETALHKLFELGFDVHRICGGCGVAPLAPVAADDLQGIGRTNDAILYGGRVTLFARGDDETIAAVGPKVPSVSSSVYGRPFLEIFEEAGRDFYQIDRHLFSPAEMVFQNVETGRVHRFGQVAPHVLRKSFGL